MFGIIENNFALSDFWHTSLGIVLFDHFNLKFNVCRKCIVKVLQLLVSFLCSVQLFYVLQQPDE